MTSDRYLGLMGLFVCTTVSSTVPLQSRVLIVQYHFGRLKRLYGYNLSLPSNSCPVQSDGQSAYRRVCAIPFVQYLAHTVRVHVASL